MSRQGRRGVSRRRRRRMSQRSTRGPSQRRRVTSAPRVTRVTRVTSTSSRRRRRAARALRAAQRWRRTGAARRARLCNPRVRCGKLQPGPAAARTPHQPCHSHAPQVRPYAAAQRRGRPHALAARGRGRGAAARSSAQLGAGAPPWRCPPLCCQPRPAALHDAWTSLPATCRLPCACLGAQSRARYAPPPAEPRRGLCHRGHGQRPAAAVGQVARRARVAGAAQVPENPRRRPGGARAEGPDQGRRVRAH